MASCVPQPIAAYYDAINRADYTALAAVLHPGYRYWAGGASFDISAYRAMLEAYRHGFSSMAVTIQQAVQDGDWVAVRTINSGIHTGLFLGHSATQRSFSALGADFLRLENGLVAEVHGLFDTIGMLQQLGIYTSRQG